MDRLLEARLVKEFEARAVVMKLVDVEETTTTALVSRSFAIDIHVLAGTNDKVGLPLARFEGNACAAESGLVVLEVDGRCDA
jgi:hypothetical protein